MIDIGSGLGGPSRYLAKRFGCSVVDVDLSASFVAAATYLADRTGLGDRVTYQQADALALPFPSGSFDVAWTQHVAMNIENR
ncbi:methyltransferase domain-containing protein, partial [Acinetobacter baumannii]